MYSQVLARRLRERGHDVVSVHERPRLEGEEDAAIFDAARREQRAILTENAAHFVPLARRASESGVDHYGLLLSDGRSLPRALNALGAYIELLDALLSTHPEEDALLGRTLWLRKPTLRSRSSGGDSLAMAHASDLDDANVLAAGDIGGLLARYEPAIRGRCIAKLHGHPDADDVAQDVRVRLLDEFRRGKRYGSLPYRVVVHQVIGWTIADYFQGRRTDVPLPEDWAPIDPDDPAADIVGRGWVEWVVSHVSGKDGEVIALRYRDQLEAPEIAARLEMTPGAVYVAIHRALKKVRMLEHA